MKPAWTRTVGAPLTILVVLVAAQQALEVPGGGVLARGLGNALHGPWFAAVTWVLQLTFVRLANRQANVATLAWGWAMALLLALASEALQIGLARHASLGDVVLNMLGATAALGLWAATVGMVRMRVAISLAVVLLVLSSTPLLSAIVVRGYQARLAPVLVRFDEPEAEWLFRSNSAVTRVDGVLEVRLADTRWPGITLPTPLADWHGYRTLVVDLEVVEALELSVSVRLVGRDHVYRSTSLAPGRHALTLELASMFDVEQERVSAVLVYSRAAFAGQTLRIREIRLE